MDLSRLQDRKADLARRKADIMDDILRYRSRSGDHSRDISRKESDLADIERQIANVERDIAREMNRR